MSGLTSGTRPRTEPKLEFDVRKVIDVSVNNFVWDTNTRNAWFKIVCDGDFKLKVQLLGETEAEGLANGFFVFPSGEGSNAKVMKVFHDDNNTLGTKMWAVR